MEGCDFCAIAKGANHSVPVVCEDDAWVAFFPLKPATTGHTLIIPRRHVADVWELDPALGADLMAAVVRVGRAVQAAVRPEGMNLISSKGGAAEQTVFHLHLHLLPRWKRDGFERIWPSGSDVDESELPSVADRIRSECSDGHEKSPPLRLG